MQTISDPGVRAGRGSQQRERRRSDYQGRDVEASIKLNHSERALIAEAAKAAGLSRAEWSRRVLLRAAARRLGTGRNR
jgi:hypothetical protein